MPRNLSAPFFSATPVFTRADYARAVGRAPEDKTVTAMLGQHVKAGNIKRTPAGFTPLCPNTPIQRPGGLTASCLPRV
jgi:hypothetical protein